MKIMVLIGFYLIIDERWVVFEACSPALVGVTIPDGQHATAAI